MDEKAKDRSGPSLLDIPAKLWSKACASIIEHRMDERKVSVTMKKGIGAPVRRKEDARLSDRRRLLQRRRRSAAAGARLRDPLRACACQDRTDRYRRAPRPSGRARGADRRRLPGRRLKPDPARCLDRRADRSAAQTSRCRADPSATAPMQPTPYYPLAVDKVRYVGEAVALVVAETLAIAKDAAELVEHRLRACCRRPPTRPRRPSRMRR